MAKRGSRAAIGLYFFLLLLMLLILFLHIFNIYPLQTDFFARYLIALVFILLLLPLVPRIKLFDIIEVKRRKKMFQAGAAAKKKK